MEIAPDLQAVDVGLARTAPGLGDVQATQEILAMHLRAIGAARRTIFIENQYLTSATLAEALAQRLEEADGPEVVLVLPQAECGWLEQSSMGVLRARAIARLEEADRHGRLRLYHPVVPGLGDGCVNVHSKVLVVDDRFLKVGSSNLSARSMGCDTEIDLAIETPDEGGDAVAAALSRFRNDLLAEHLGTSPEVVGRRIAETGSLISAIESLRGGARSLEPLRPTSPEEAPVNLPGIDGGIICDPERPIAADTFLTEALPEDVQKPSHRKLWTVVGLAGVVLALGALWRFTPLRQLLDLERLAALGEFLRGSAAGPFYAVGAFVVGGLIFFPVTALIAATALIFPPAIAMAVALGGSLASASAAYVVGRLVRNTAIRKLWADRVDKLSAQVNKRGVVAIVAVRMLPVANFSLINLLAGALDVRFWRYFVGTAIGLLPGTLGMTLFADRVESTIREPRFGNVALLGVVFILMVLGIGWLRRVIGRATAAAPAPMRGQVT